jgi:hypothetical protein
MSRKKLIGLLSIFLVMGIAFTTINVKAHNPMHLDFLYDADNDILWVTVIHGVTDPNYHYVKSIEIQVNDTTFTTEFYSSQPTRNIFTYNFSSIVLTVDDDVKAIAICSLHGSYTGHVIWSYWEDKGSFSSVIGPTLISTLIVAGIVIIPGISQKLKKRK